MKQKTNWKKITFITGVVALIVGALDPLEGSVIILTGSVLVAVSTQLLKDRHRKLFLAALLMIAVGICFLFYFSSLGGFGGNSSLSWWWSILILPYPIGWLLSIILLIKRSFTKQKPQSAI